MNRPPELARWRRIWQQVARIPAGRVATYGQIAALAGLPRHARQVGYALYALPEGSEVPWQRVVNARGEVSARRQPGSEPLQRLLLEEEGVVFDAEGRIDLSRFRWEPEARRPRPPRRAPAGRREPVPPRGDGSPRPRRRAPRG
ncbi:MAG: MGMT family protein [Thermoanaerobaculia bacterium]